MPIYLLSVPKHIESLRMYFHGCYGVRQKLTVIFLSISFYYSCISNISKLGEMFKIQNTFDLTIVCNLMLT